MSTATFQWGANLRECTSRLDFSSPQCQNAECCTAAYPCRTVSFPLKQWRCLRFDSNAAASRCIEDATQRMTWCRRQWQLPNRAARSVVGEKLGVTKFRLLASRAGEPPLQQESVTDEGRSNEGLQSQGQLAPAQDPRATYENRKIQQEEGRRASMGEYALLKAELKKLTLGVSTVGVLYCFLTVSVEAAFSYGFGAAGSFLYLLMLFRGADTMTEDTIPEVFRIRRTYSGPSSNRKSPSQQLLKAFEGSRRALSSQRLTIPAILMGLWALSLHMAEDLPEGLHLELAPLLFGFLSYKAAVLILTYRANEDLIR
eukprot:TRINITY_DN5108_c0_g1_i1.p1 TRINITY_DN5108_c0_g1~~TRINITY_DN5108_c0_g1_i1.p1  ORF type:complete len:314 (+),score=35.15 TRINITY_DN5108_c0_g1_i1:241-1182(+)